MSAFKSTFGGCMGIVVAAAIVALLVVGGCLGGCGACAWIGHQVEQTQGR